MSVRERSAASCSTRNQHPAPAEANSALIRLVRKAYSPNGKSMPHTWPMRTKSGVPGGCGMPRVFIAAPNSPASQKVTEGARERRSPARTTAETTSAVRYGGGLVALLHRTPGELAEEALPRRPHHDRASQGAERARSAEELDGLPGRLAEA